MRKNHFRNKNKSMFGSSEKDEELKGSYIEMEENYKKIIEILKDEDMDDRKKVVEMIEDFHKHHQSVYERYDHIRGELKEKVHSKIEKDSSFSSSSDSDSDDTFTKKGSKNGKLKVRDILKEQLQAANTEIDVLIEKLKVATEEKEALKSVVSLKDDLQRQFESEKQDYLRLQNQLKDKIEKMEMTVREKEQTIEQLEDSIEDLKGDLEIKGNDVTTLTETVRNLEVKIRLTNQKLRVTEQTLSEKEDDHTEKEEKLHQENKSLVLKISTLSEIITTCFQKKIKNKEIITCYKEKVSKMMIQLKALETEKEKLTNLVDQLEQKAVGKDEKFNEKMLKMMIQLKALETEKEKLTNSVDQLEQKAVGKDEKFKELETLIHVKDERLLDLGEEKREAIRQLCMLLDYQRERYDRLQELLLRKTTDGRR